MKIITFGNFKGGTGKSSLAGLQAIKLSQTKKVLLIDLDYQCNLTKLVEANYEVPKSNKSIFNILKRQSIVDNIIKITDNLDLLPATTSHRKPSIDWLDKALGEALKQVSYDYIIIDTRPDIDVLVQSALIISDLVCIVLEPSLISLDGAITYQNKLDELCNTYNTSIKRIKRIFIVNKFTKNDEDFLSHIPSDTEFYTIPYSNRIRRYSNTGFPVKPDYHDRNVIERIMTLNGNRNNNQRK